MNPSVYYKSGLNKNLAVDIVGSLGHDSSAWRQSRQRKQCGVNHFRRVRLMEPTTVGSLWLENDLHENELEFESYIGTNNCWFPLARKWPTWKWTWIWILYGKIEKKCPRYFRRDSRGNPRDLNMCRTGRSAALSRGRKFMTPRRESMKLVVQQRKFT